MFSSAAADNDDAMPAMEDEDSDSVTLRRRRLAAAAERRMQRQEPSPFWAEQIKAWCCPWDRHAIIEFWADQCTFVLDATMYVPIKHFNQLSFEVIYGAIAAPVNYSQILASVK